MSSVGLFGGTFDPPHTGHFELARAAIIELPLDLIYIVPAGIPPHKELSEKSGCAQMRFEMARLCFSGLPGARILDYELYSPGKSYTINTLRHLREIHPRDTLYLICGSDMFLTLKTWKSIEEYSALVSIAVAARNGENSAHLRTFAEELHASQGLCVTMLRSQIPSVSSTELRRELAAGLHPSLISPEIYDYICKNGLYGVCKK